MTPDEDIDAGERALGTLPARAETAGEERAREEWEMRLAPILDVFESIAPPPGLFERIERELEGDTMVVNLDRQKWRARNWQAVATIAVAAAALFAIWIFVPTEAPAIRYVAVVTADEGAGIADADRVGMVIEFDTASGVATVIPIGASAPQGRAAEMWHLPDGAAEPYSLGLMPDGPSIRREIKAGPGDIFAISFEQPGGSPTGQPTDARFHGKIVVVE